LNQLTEQRQRVVELKDEANKVSEEKQKIGSGLQVLMKKHANVEASLKQKDTDIKQRDHQLLQVNQQMTSLEEQITHLRAQLTIASAKVVTAEAKAADAETKAAKVSSSVITSSGVRSGPSSTELQALIDAQTKPLQLQLQATIRRHNEEALDAVNQINSSKAAIAQQQDSIVSLTTELKTVNPSTKLDLTLVMIDSFFTVWVCWCRYEKHIKQRRQQRHHQWHQQVHQW
jgi:chromosome segregation ATPase